MVYYRALRQHFCQTKSFKHSSKRNVSMMVIGKHRAYLKSLRHHIKGFIITFLVGFSGNLRGKTLGVGLINATRISSPPDNFQNRLFPFYSMFRVKKCGEYSGSFHNVLSSTKALFEWKNTNGPF
ncbi:CFF_HP2_G0022880.mRNA.1.CDS.1 [Saccharomyces cerevisiae]|nr:CFF_HP2_G0022880.mRNA.1.CDS.1 [Saccharomyces cerevisiae]CAI6441685.1 CFF_HP2_G0022880.mRNA.1.CDS.1 [Saccharomyces cerevisiae]CAI6443510.1 CFF_HP1_G0023290.mRNA.1.CDS.1 [Saccharomyces cerevisiae]